MARIMTRTEQDMQRLEKDIDAIIEGMEDEAAIGNTKFVRIVAKQGYEDIRSTRKQLKEYLVFLKELDRRLGKAIDQSLATIDDLRRQRGM